MLQCSLELGELRVEPELSVVFVVCGALKKVVLSSLKLATATLSAS